MEKEAYLSPRAKAAEAGRLHQPGETKHIGRMLLEAKPETKDKNKRPEMSLEQLEMLGRAELLEISADILVEGSSLKQIYESHLIGEQGLRRLIAEHYRRGNLEKALKKEIIEREIDFERDPSLRDLPTEDISTKPIENQSDIAALEELIKKADQSLPSDNEELAFYKARANYEIDQRLKQTHQRNKLELLMVAIVAVLLILTALIYLSKSH